MTYMKRKTFLSILVLLMVSGCYIPSGVVATPTITFTPLVAVTPTETAFPTQPPPELGLLENPLILSLPPGSNSQEQIDAAKVIAELFTQRTGYVVVTVVPDSTSALMQALENGNIHIALLDPLSYELAYQEGFASAAYTILQDGEAAYGAQFIAARKDGYKSYFDELSKTNLGEASEALAQFEDKKPCWSDEISPSGYIIPLGFLNQNQVATRPAAFVQGHPTVVRSIYLGGICDFGATYVDARKFPSLEDQYPDLIEQVLVIWRMPDIIPYAVLAFSTKMPQNMRDLFSVTIPAILQTTTGKEAFKMAYDIDDMLPVTDTYFDEFHKYMQASQVELSELIK